MAEIIIYITMICGIQTLQNTDIEYKDKVKICKDFMQECIKSEKTIEKAHLCTDQLNTKSKTK